MFLLCSDGLSNMMDDSDIEGILTLNGENIVKSRYENGIIIMSIYDFLLDPNSLEY
jgi:serine/threonine protein phosphatase PrpC